MKSFELTVVTYHYVRDVAGTEFPYLKALAVPDFERQLDFLQKQYAMVSWRQVADFLANGVPLPERACLLTFDDGTKDHYQNVFPRLKDRGLSGLFFAIAPDGSAAVRPVHMLQMLLAKFGYEDFRRMFESRLSDTERNELLRQQTEYIEAHPEGKFGEVESRAFRKVIQTTFLGSALPIISVLGLEHVPGVTSDSLYLTHDEIEEMVRGGMYFGGHGKRHEYLTLMTPDEIREELAAAKEFLESIQPGPYAFNYPYGVYNETVTKYVEEAGFLAACATDNKGPAQDWQFEIHRLDCTHSTLQGR